jgi:hypothetical protein
MLRTIALEITQCISGETDERFAYGKPSRRDFESEAIYDSRMALAAETSARELREGGANSLRRNS